MVEPQPSKLVTWVRFPSPAPLVAAGVAELADARDLKSRGWKQPYRFDSGPRHQKKKTLDNTSKECYNKYVTCGRGEIGRRASFRR